MIPENPEEHYDAMVCNDIQAKAPESRKQLRPDIHHGALPCEPQSARSVRTSSDADPCCKPEDDAMIVEHVVAAISLDTEEAPMHPSFSDNRAASSSGEGWQASDAQSTARSQVCLAVPQAAGDAEMPLDDLEDMGARAQRTSLHQVGSAGSMMTAATSTSASNSQGGEKRPREFQVFLRRAEGISLGTIVSVSSQGGMLTVKSVLEGRMQQWNLSHPGAKVKKGDHIIQVNGISGNAEALLQEFQKDVALELTVRTREHKRSSGGRNTDSQDMSSSLTLLGRALPPAKQPASTALKDSIPRLNLQQAQAQVGQPQPFAVRGLHPHSAELMKAKDTVMLDRSRIKPSQGGTEGSASECSECDYSSAAADSETAFMVAAEMSMSSGPGEDAIMKLSPRTRSVWSRRLGSPFPSEQEEPEESDRQQKQKRVTAREEDLCPEVPSEVHLEVQPEELEVVWEVSMSKEFTARTSKASNGQAATKSFASAGNLQLLASRTRPPGFWRQLAMLTQRSTIQWWRGNYHRGIFLGVISGSSAILAIMDTFVVQEAEWQILPFLNLHTTLALLTCVFCLNVFSTDRPVFWRERESGLNVAAFYASKTLVNMLDLLLQCFLLAAIYYMIRQPLVSFEIYFVPFLLVSFASAGLGYLISTVFPPKHGPFISAITIFVVCGLLGHPLRVQTMADGGFLELVMDFLSITRWSVAYYWSNYFDSLNLARLQSDPAAMQAINGIEEIYKRPGIIPDRLGGMRTEFVFLMGMGAVWQLTGYFVLAYSNRHRHRRASPWKQRMHSCVNFANELSLRCIGEERQAEIQRALGNLCGRSARGDVAYDRGV